MTTPAAEKIPIVVEVDGAMMLESVLDEMDPELAASAIAKAARADTVFGLLLETNLTVALDEVLHGERPDTVT